MIREFQNLDKRKIWLIFLLNSLLSLLVPIQSRAAFDAPPPDPISFALGNIASFPDFDRLDEPIARKWLLSVSGARLFSMPEIQPFSLRLTSLAFRARWSLLAYGLQYGPYSEVGTSIGYQRHIFPILTAGLEAGFMQISIKDYGASWTYQINARLQWQVTPQAELALYWKNLSDARIGVGHYPLPQTLALGSLIKPLPQINLFAEVEQDFRYDISTRMGVCYELLKRVNLMLGFQSQPNLLTLGGSGLIGHVRATAAFQYHSELGLSQCYGLTIFF